MADIQELLKRVEAASGPDREIDARIDCWLKGRTWKGWTGHYYLSEELAGSSGGDEVERYTASIDAALALVEKVLPGWCVLMAFNSTKIKARANVHSEPLGTTGVWPEGAKAATLPLAILAALLSALSHTDTRSGEGR